MKQLSILNGKVHVVELPEGAIKPRITQPFGIYLTFNDRFGFNRIKLPPGIWQIVGMLSEVTEEQAHDIVQSFKFKGGYLYNNYITGNRDTTDTALESLESAIRAEGWYLDDNPIKVHTWASENADDYKKQYDAAKFRVLSRERLLLLRRTDG